MNIPANRVTEIREHSLRGASLTAGGKKAISLAIGEPGFATPACIVKAQAEAVAQGLTHYAPQPGDPVLVSAILKYALPAYLSSMTPENVLITHGGTAGLSCSILGLINPGDGVLIENPTYSLYADSVRMAGGRIETFSRTDDGSLDFDEIRARASNTKMLIICQPSNPTGTILTRQEWQQIAQIAAEFNLIVLSDEAYDGIIFDGCTFVSALDVAALQDRLIVCRTFSKKYAMTGWRVGYLVGARALIGAALVIHRTFNGAVNSANQRAAAIALSDAAQAAESMRVEFQARRALMINCLEGKVDLQFAIPSGAFYLWVAYPTAFGNSQAVAQKCFEQGVTIRPGSEFGTKGKYRIRLSFAPERANIEEGCQRLLTVFAPS